MNRVVLLSLRLAAFSFLLSNQVTAQEQSLAPDYRNFALRTDASDMPKDGIQVFACGSDGGPPLQALSGWEDYSKCARDKRGLHEVYVEFDTSLSASSMQPKTNTRSARGSRSMRVPALPVSPWSCRCFLTIAALLVALGWSPTKEQDSMSESAPSCLSSESCRDTGEPVGHA